MLSIAPESVQTGWGLRDRKIQTGHAKLLNSEDGKMDLYQERVAAAGLMHISISDPFFAKLQSVDTPLPEPNPNSFR